MEIKDKIGIYPNVAVKPGTPAEEVKPAEFDTCERHHKRIAELTAERDELREALDALEMGQMYYLYQAKNAVIEKLESDYNRLMEVVKTQASSFGKIEFDLNLANGEIKRLEEKYKRLEEERDNLETRCRDMQGRLDEICKLAGGAK